MVQGLVALLLAAASTRPFPEERLLLDRRLETLRRILPDGPTLTTDAALVKELAEGSKLARVEVQARPPQEAGIRGDVVVELSAQGRFGDVDRFFRQVALSPRLLDVESITLSATSEGIVRLASVLRLPYRPLKAPLPPPPDGLRSRLNGVPRPAADAFLRDQALALAKSETVAALRRARRNPRLFLSEVAVVVRDRPVVLTHAALGDEFVVRGLAVGEGSVRALETRFERGFFRISEFLVARQAACYRFEVRGKSPVAGVEAELPLPAEDPFDQDETPCRVDRDQARSVVLKGPPAGKISGKGALSLRLREVDLADVFRILHLVTSQAFIVDGDVTGRVSLDLTRLTLDEVLTALTKSGLDLSVSDPGPLRRVSAVRGKLPSLPTPAGSPAASFALKRAEVRDVLAVMTDMDAGLAALGPQGFLGRVSLWAKDLPVAALRAAVLDAVGLTERMEEGRRILSRRGGSEEAVFPVAGTPPERRLVLRPKDLAVLEFELAGVASSGEAWTAYAYSPTGALNAYRAGDALADGIIKSVDSTDIVIETDEGPLRLPIAPLPK
jgi:hypothetical protein